jgi:hypothetical protein
MKTLITGALGALLLLAVGPAAHADDPALTPPIGVYSEPRFKLEALRFKAIDETGIDVWPFSDEVKVIIEVPNHAVTITQLFTDVDAGETRNIPSDQSCMLPIAGSNQFWFRGDYGHTWRCFADGARGPFSFTVELREIDFWKCGFSGYAGCDLIGRRTVTYSMEELLALHVGQVLEESVTLGGPCGDTQDVCGTGFPPSPTGPEYVFTWRITRLPDALVTPPIGDHFTATSQSASVAN